MFLKIRHYLVEKSLSRGLSQSLNLRIIQNDRWTVLGRDLNVFEPNAVGVFNVHACDR